MACSSLHLHSEGTLCMWTTDLTLAAPSNVFHLSNTAVVPEGAQSKWVYTHTKKENIWQSRPSFQLIWHHKMIFFFSINFLLWIIYLGRCWREAWAIYWNDADLIFREKIKKTTLNVALRAEMRVSFVAEKRESLAFICLQMIYKWSVRLTRFIYGLWAWQHQQRKQANLRASAAEFRGNVINGSFSAGIQYRLITTPFHNWPFIKVQLCQDRAHYGFQTPPQ